MAGFGRRRHSAHRRKGGVGVILGDGAHHCGQRQPHESANVKRREVQSFVGRRESDDRNVKQRGHDARNRQPAVENVHQRTAGIYSRQNSVDEQDNRQKRGEDSAAVGAGENASDDRRDDGGAADEQRQGDGGQRGFGVGKQQRAQHHCGDDGHGVGFEEVGGHSGAVADIVADIVGDDGGVARVVFGDSGLHFADQVGAHIGAFCEDSPAESGEDGDERPAESESDERVDDFPQGFGVFHGGADSAGVLQEDDVISGAAQQSESDDQHSGDGPPAEGDGEGLVDPVAGGFGGSDVCAHGDIHSDVSGGGGKDGADGESDGGGPVEEGPDGGEEHDAHDGDGAILTVKVGGGALLHGGGDLPHAVVSVRQGENPAGGNRPVNNGHGRANDRDKQGKLGGHGWGSFRIWEKNGKGIL